jgi:hypothetical protein
MNIAERTQRESMLTIGVGIVKMRLSESERRTVPKLFPERGKDN